MRTTATVPVLSGEPRQNSIALLDSYEFGGKMQEGKSSSSRKQVLHMPIAQTAASARLPLKNTVVKLKDARILSATCAEKLLLA